MVLPFLNRRRKERVCQWRQEVRSVAEQYWPAGELPVTGPIMLTITYFYDSVSMDVDNIPKPISDALKGLVYLDDEQVTDILCRKRNLNSDLRIENPCPSGDEIGRASCRERV